MGALKYSMIHLWEELQGLCRKDPRRSPQRGTSSFGRSSFRLLNEGEIPSVVGFAPVSPGCEFR